MSRPYRITVLAALPVVLLIWFGYRAIRQASLDRATAFAAAKGDAATVDRLLSQGANVGVRGTGESTLLMRAAFHDQIEVVRTLLAHGADANAVDSDGNTAAMRAAGKGNDTVLQMLIDVGARVNEKGYHGMTALMLAKHFKHDGTANKLRRAGANE